MVILPKSPPQITPEKINKLAEFLPDWYPEEGWPPSAPLTVDERNLVSGALWQDPEITWLRVLGTVLSPGAERQYLETSLLVHFTTFLHDIERMFAYWLHSRHLHDYGEVLLQTYYSVKIGAHYPALAGVVPLAETVIAREGYKKARRLDYQSFYGKFQGGAGVKTANAFTAVLYESDPRGGIDNRERYNRHILAHGLLPGFVTWLDLISGCLILDMVVSTVETGGHLLDRVLERL